MAEREEIMGKYFPPSDWLTQFASQIFGPLAERVIRAHYESVMNPGTAPNNWWFDGSGTNAYFEVFLPRSPFPTYPWH
jgi:hypothetical protein